MDELRRVLEDNLNNEFLTAVLSNPRDAGDAIKVKVRPILKKDQLLFQIETLRGRQAFHENLGASVTCERILELMKNMKQMQMETRDAFYTVLVSKKGKVTIKKKIQHTEKQVSLSHNRKKRYILEEGVMVPFLVDLGVMTKEGRVVRARFDKFRQITGNRKTFQLERNPGAVVNIVLFYFIDVSYAIIISFIDKIR